MDTTKISKRLDNIMFIDIETVPLTEHLAELPDAMQSLWTTKADNISTKNYHRNEAIDSHSDEFYFNNAGIYSEFAKIVCISIGVFTCENEKTNLRIKSLAGDNEIAILQDFAYILQRFSTNRNHQICGHNIKEFDIPFVCRRMLINGISIPDCINVAGKKPWEVPFADTLELWRFGDYKSYTSLKLLTTILGIPTPKDDIDGSQVTHVFYKEKDVARIARYCQKDVLATARVYQRLNNMLPIEDDSVFFVE